MRRDRTTKRWTLSRGPVSRETGPLFCPVYASAGCRCPQNGFRSSPRRCSEAARMPSLAERQKAAYWRESLRPSLRPRRVAASVGAYGAFTYVGKVPECPGDATLHLPLRRWCCVLEAIRPFPFSCVRDIGPRMVHVSPWQPGVGIRAVLRLRLCWADWLPAGYGRCPVRWAVASALLRSEPPLLALERRARQSALALQHALPAHFRFT